MKAQISILLIVFSLGCTNHVVPTEEVRQTFVLSDQTYATTTTYTAAIEPLRNEMKFYGSITADNNKMIEIFPAVGGNVVAVHVELGDYVKKGQLLATIRSIEVAGFEKELKDAENDLVIARNNHKVATELFEGKLSTERDVLEAYNQLEKAQTQLKRVKETYQIYSMKPGSIYEVRSPINGFVIQKNINQDMLLRNDRTNNIFDIAEIEDVWAIANVNETDINQVKLGVDAFITSLSYPGQVFQGKVDKIFNIIDPETKAMKVRIKLPNPDYLLKPQMRANIKISFTEDENKISIPSSAIIFDKSKSFVMVYKDRNNIETREVTVLREVSGQAFLDGGLQEGEKVITSNQLFIYDSLND